MTDFLDRVASWTHGSANLVRPVLASRYMPAGLANPLQDSLDAVSTDAATLVDEPVGRVASHTRQQVSGRDTRESAPPPVFPAQRGQQAVPGTSSSQAQSPQSSLGTTDIVRPRIYAPERPISNNVADHGAREPRPLVLRPSPPPFTDPTSTPAREHSASWGPRTLSGGKFEPREGAQLPVQARVPKADKPPALREQGALEPAVLAEPRPAIEVTSAGTFHALAIEVTADETIKDAGRTSTSVTPVENHPTPVALANGRDSGHERQAAAPEVHVTIGRIEVRATQLPAQSGVPSPRPQTLSLSTYLQQHRARP